MRTVLALLTAMLATFAIVTPEVAADPMNPCTPNHCRDDGDPTATCTPTFTGYVCICDVGFISNGQTCTPQGLCSVVTCPPPSDACHVQGTCDPTTGQCSNPAAPDGTACNDGNACTQPDTCQSGVCVGSNSIEPPLTDFRDGRRPNDINIGPDLGGTRHQALNFTGNAGAAGDTWITVYDPAPNPPSATCGSVNLSADVLIHVYNNTKGAGLLALYNEASGKKGLALTLYDAGSTDTLVLATVDQAGKLVTLKTVSLGAAIAENVWYRVSMDVAITGSVVSVTGTVFRHQTPTDPNSALTTQVGMPLTFSATLEAGALVGVDATGEVGILAAAVNAANSSSVTNITIER
jgi:hypothetical protein